MEPIWRRRAEPASSIIRALDEGDAGVRTPSGAWLHADDHSAAVELVLREGRSGEIYAVGEADEAIRSLDWKPRLSLEEGIAETAEWFRAHRDWWEPIRSRAGTPPHEEQYASRDS